MTDLLARAANWLVAPRDERAAEEERPSATEWLEPSSPSGRDAAARANRALAPTRPAFGSWSPDAPSLARRPFAAPAPATPIDAGGVVAVLGPADDVPALAASIALVLRRRAHAAAALVLAWASEAGAAPFGAHGLPGARLLAARLGRRGLAARPRGRLVWLPVRPDGEEDPRLVLRRAEAAAGRAPCVLAVAAPRDRRVESILAGCALAVVAAEPDSALAGLALAELEAIGVPARAVAPLPEGFARIAALGGLRAHVDGTEVIA